MVYVAFLRGIGPTNPNMRGEKLRRVFEGLGFKNVRTVLASGNVIFQSGSRNAKSLEGSIETALHDRLGFRTTALVRTRDALRALTAPKIFGNKTDTPTTRLNVTFLKKGGQVASVIDLTRTRTPEIMRKLEREHGREITTRTWKTILRILREVD